MAVKIFSLEEFESHLCQEEEEDHDLNRNQTSGPLSPPTLPQSTPRAATLADVLRRTVETPTTVEKRTTANIVQRMITSSSTEANDVEVILPGKRGKAI